MAHLTISEAELRQRIESGERLAEIAREFGVHPVTVGRRCAELGILVPQARGPRIAVSRGDMPHLVLMLRTGSTVAEAADHFGVQAPKPEASQADLAALADLQI